MKEEPKKNDLRLQKCTRCSPQGNSRHGSQYQRCIIISRSLHKTLRLCVFVCASDTRRPAPKTSLAETNCGRPRKGRAQCPNTRNVSFTGRAKCWHQLGTDFKRPETREEVEDLQGLAAASEELLTGYLIKNLSLLLFPLFLLFLSRWTNPL